MAFHVACPITCRRICFCALGFQRSPDFLRQVGELEEFLKDPLGIKAKHENGVVQVAVPKVAVAPTPPLPQAQAQTQQGVGAGGVSAADEEAAAAAVAMSAQTKRVALQKKAAAMVVAAEDYARQFESGDLAGGASKDVAGEEQGQSNNANVLCRMCFFGEPEGSERARKMLSCKSCGKKYHRACIKNWARHRDLFHWSSWTCPSCRICEVCRRTGDPNKFMFCRRCDAAYHCYCQHPPHKNVSSGPYLCPKHTRCHSCGSNVPGNGLSVRWFLGYTCCDACGRLFVKGNYCPVCLKVYRDSESTPMVCCDVCQRWVHCECDGISDERYQQFQEDGNLQYKCATCRGECYQVKDLEDAVQELWRRKDEADRDLIASLRAAAGLPTQDEIFSISPYSDDEDNGPVTSKNEFGRSIRFSLKGLSTKSPKKNKDSGKKSSHKKYSKRKRFQASLSGKEEETGSFGGQHDAQSSQDSLDDDKNGDVQSYGYKGPKPISSSFPGRESYKQATYSGDQPAVFKHKFVKEVMMSNEDKAPTLKIRSSKPHVSDSEENSGKHANKAKSTKTKKLVISLGPRKINVSNSPNSDASSCQREQDSATFRGVGSEDESWQRTSNKYPVDRLDGDTKSVHGDRVDHSGPLKGLKSAGRGGNVIKLGKVRPEIGESNSNISRGTGSDVRESVPQEQSRVSSRRRSGEGSTDFSLNDDFKLKGDKVPFGKLSEGRPRKYGDNNDDYSNSPVSHSLPKDSRPLLKLKFKKPQSENRNSLLSHVEEVKNIDKGQEEEKSNVKGQRSKRKRPSVFVEKSSLDEDEGDPQVRNENLMDEYMDANWILKKLGKDGIGKRVEVQQQPSDSSWHRGVVTDIDDSTSTLYVTLDDGRLRTLQLGKQGVRFVPQQQKKSRA